MLKDVTLIIPTHNRHQYLTRVLDYYSYSEIIIFVCDSSNAIFKDKKRYKNVKYFYYKDNTMVDKLAKVLKEVKTPFVVICADDDFIIPSAIKKSVEFLKKNKDYSSVQGHNISFYNTGKKIVYGPSLMHTIGININQKSAEERVKEQLKKHTEQFYSVQRIENLKESYQYMQNKIIDYNLMELIAIITSGINGKHKALPIFYGVRESIENSTGNYTITFDKLIKMKEYKTQYKEFIKILVINLSKKENKTIKEARHIISRIIYFYINILIKERNKKKVIIINKIESFSKKISKLLKWTYFELKRINRIYLTKDYRGFPFYDIDAKKELKRIDYIVKKHNIVGKWRSIVD